MNPSKLVQNLKTFISEGGHLYLDRSYNLNVATSRPNKNKVFLGSIHRPNQKEKKEMKIQAVQKQLAAYGIAFKSDILKLEREIKNLKKDMKKK